MMKVKHLLKRLLLRNTRLASSLYRVADAHRTARFLKNPGAFGQCREDEWFLSWLQQRGDWKTGTYVDIGANHPVIFSATFLLYRTGWRGVTVEPIPYLCEAHRRMRPGDLCINAGVGQASGEAPFWETVPHVFSSFSHEDAKSAQSRGFCRILQQATVPILSPRQILETSQPLISRNIDYLSIDTEGLDLTILENWPMAENSPEVISCEAGACGYHAEKVSGFLKSKGYLPLKEFHTVSFWLLSSGLKR